ncbi:MAG: GNAT family N-acetyltransferase [Deltaproteobacteria bacterium]|nr:GNAT family N-acetyltransferase [Deltaproteobacteria bacterium]MBW2052535.1 GNAT family N-acetyltransferase [Deltaproteobacteria bacterium]MBW2323579.1 GNAT family N-acetyltransferase [Deltaproteobacteria bacterium]
MANVLNDFSLNALTKAIDANQIDGYIAFGCGDGAELHQDPDMTWIYTGIPYPLFNGVLCARLSSDTVDERIEETINYFKYRNTPMMWWTGPCTHPPDLEKHLRAHGLVFAGNQPGMALDLLTVNKDMPLPKDLKIERVKNEKDLKDWLYPVSMGFNLPQFAAKALLKHFNGLDLTKSFPRRHYVGRLNGTPVASSTLFLGAGVAGIYYVATIKKARRRGIGAAMTLTPLIEARQMAYRIGILQASDLGLGLYRRIGFKEYCTLGRYIYLETLG